LALIHKTNPYITQSLPSIMVKSLENNFKNLATLIKLHRPKIIFHLTGITQSNDPEIESVNTLLVQTLVDTVEKNDPSSKIIFLSSAAIYGEGKDRIPLSEESTPYPINRYGETKLEAEQILKRFSDRGGKAYIVRAFNVIGPRQKDHFFLPSLCRKLLEPGSCLVEIYDEHAVRDFIDVRDLVNMLVLFLKTQPKEQIYNACSGHGRSVREVAEIARTLALAPRKRLQYLPSSKLQSIHVSVGSAIRAESILNFKAAISLEDSIRDILTGLA
jgi:GDP-4-dehydro-6-deoxy-D-mannose reductase